LDALHALTEEFAERSTAAFRLSVYDAAQGICYSTHTPPADFLRQNNLII